LSAAFDPSKWFRNQEVEIRRERELNQEQLEEAIRMAELVEPDGDLITFVDVTPVNRR